MIRIILTVSVMLTITMSCHHKIAATQVEENDHGFELLFNGNSLEGWRGYQKDHLPTKWIVDHGTIHFDPTIDGEGGTIIYDQVFSNFHLKIEWRISENGNSGIFYLGSEDPSFRRIYQTAPEMQVLDNAGHPDAKLGKDGNRQAGSLYDLIPANPQNFKGYGEWNQAEVIHRDGHVVHIQNGEKVLEYQTGTSGWKELVAGSKFPGLNPNWADLSSEGYIGIQDHGDEVWFRNIQIKEI